MLSILMNQAASLLWGRVYRDSVELLRRSGVRSLGVRMSAYLYSIRCLYSCRNEESCLNLSSLSRFLPAISCTHSSHIIGHASFNSRYMMVALYASMHSRLEWALSINRIISGDDELSLQFGSPFMSDSTQSIKLCTALYFSSSLFQILLILWSIFPCKHSHKGNTSEQKPFDNLNTKEQQIWLKSDLNFVFFLHITIRCVKFNSFKFYWILSFPSSFPITAFLILSCKVVASIFYINIFPGECLQIKIAFFDISKTSYYINVMRFL